MNTSESHAYLLHEVAPETEENETIEFAFYWDYDKSSVIVCTYITLEDQSWKNAYEQQNPVHFIGYYSHNDFHFKDADDEINEKITKINL